MYLQKIILKNHRNFENVLLEPSNQFNVIWGNNAQGKTNLLEAIYLLGNIRSFRSNKNEELIGNHSKSSSISGKVISHEVNRQLELIIKADRKEIKVDGKDIKSVGKFLDFFRPVLFSPEEVSIVKGSPSGRRSLIDRAIFQASPSYLEKAQLYERCLRQRNILLKSQRTDYELLPWTEQLIRSGARIRFERIIYLARLVPLLQDIYFAISGGHEKANLKYLPNEENEEKLQQTLRRELARVEVKEKFFGQTLFGPHRDDPLFLVDEMPLRTFGSQGQQRSFMLAFKTAQILDLEKQRGEPPVLLLDDMTGELDRRRQEFFFNFLLKRRGQVFITTTDIDFFKKEGMQDASFFRISQGKIQ